MDHRADAKSERGGGDVSDSPVTEQDIGLEAGRLADAANGEGLELRLLGGIAIARSCPSAQRPQLRRSYGDIDVVVPANQHRGAEELLERLGYVGDQRFNALNRKTRLLFFDVARERQVDIFVGGFRMCHEFDFKGRFLPGYESLPLADLFLTKLQIVELNDKDAKDALTLLLDHGITVGEAPETIDSERIASLCANDWGLYTTVGDNLALLETRAPDWLGGSELSLVLSRIAEVREAIEAAPKSLRWRARSRVGRRVAWYELPEEVREKP